MIDIKILYEDKDLLALLKPKGVVVNRSQTTKDVTLQDWIETQYPKSFAINDNHPDSEFISRSGMVHRLDKDTSGVILWSKNEATMYSLMSQFKEREVYKTYWALTHGRLDPAVGSVSVPLGRLSGNRKKFGVVIGGKMSKTDYKVLNTYKSNSNYPGGFSLVELYPKTGRTHQLRVVLNHLNHPIVGDKVYAGKKRSKKDLVWCGRQFLHAKKIELIHPSTKEKLAISAPLSADLQKVVATLDKE